MRTEPARGDLPKSSKTNPYSTSRYIPTAVELPVPAEGAIDVDVDAGGHDAGEEESASQEGARHDVIVERRAITCAFITPQGDTARPWPGPVPRTSPAR